MLINGPNARNDFHQTNSEEFFHQLQGDIVVRIIEDGRIKDVPVREGETFFIPGGVPHSPTRPPNTLGLVVERNRPPEESEHLQFYCEKCHALVWKTWSFTARTSSSIFRRRWKSSGPMHRAAHARTAARA